MKKRIIALIAILSLLCMTSITVFAETADEQPTATETADKNYIVDDANIFNQEDIRYLNRMASRIFAAYGYDPVVYTCKKPDGKEEFKLSTAANNFITEHEEYNSGMLLIMQCSDEPEMLVVSFGRAKKIFEDDARESITNSVNSAQSEYSAATVFQQRIKYYLNYYGVQSAFDINSKPLKLIDNADLLSNNEEEELIEKLDETSKSQRLDIVIVTEESIENKTPLEYADYFYDYNGYGYGDNYDGILLLISMENRDWAISTFGTGIKIFTDAGQTYISDKIVPYLKDAEYYDAFDEFISQCNDFSEHYYDDGSAYDVGDMPKGNMPVMTFLLVSIVIGLITGLVTTSIYKGQLTSVKYQPNADFYIRNGSVNINNRSDIFLYNIVNKREINRDNEDRGRSGGQGGSTTHTSSNGRTHGGSSGHF